MPLGFALAGFLTFLVWVAAFPTALDHLDVAAALAAADQWRAAAMTRTGGAGCSGRCAADSARLDLHRAGGRRLGAARHAVPLRPACRAASL